MADPDLRERILAAFNAALADIDGVETVARNLDEISDSKLPAVIGFDGDEEAYDNPAAIGAKPNVIYMMPIAQVSLGDVPESVGTVANEWIAKVKKAVLLDATIASLTDGIRHGGARYLAAQTSLTPGRTTQVTITMHFSIGYPFRPTSL